VTHHQTVKAAVVWAVNGVVMGVVAVMMASVSGVDTGAICTGMCAIGSSWLNIGRLVETDRARGTGNPSPISEQSAKHMSYVTTQPEMLSAAAGDLQGIGSAASAANAAAAAPTTGVHGHKKSPVTDRRGSRRR
jgi:hypothetical protein